MRISSTVILLGTVSLLAACSGSPVSKIDRGEAQYWQRVNTSSLIYTQGPKAQQMLHRDIGRCVTELRELEHLGVVRNAIPADSDGRVLDPDDARLAEWDTPERDGHLFSEHTDYHDFEGCMLSKGWERIKHVPYDVSVKARDTYIATLKDYGYGSKFDNRGERRMDRAVKPSAEGSAPRDSDGYNQ